MINRICRKCQHVWKTTNADEACPKCGTPRQAPAKPQGPPKNRAAVVLGRLGGRAGRGTSKARPSEVMRQAALKRWANRKLNSAKP